MAKLTEATLRERVAAGKTDGEIAGEAGVSERTIRYRLKALGIKRERKAKSEPRGPGYVLRFDDEDQREEVHTAARAAGRDTSEWLLDLALEGPTLARTARDPSLPLPEKRAALAELFTLLLGESETTTTD